MNDTKIASKAKAQLANFMGKVFTHFSKPAKKFIEECIYGIQASGDTKLSSIVRAIDDDTRPIYTENRLSRNMDDEVLKIIRAVYAATGGKGTVVFDRGGRAAYAIADGIRRAFTRFGKWVRTAADTIAKAHGVPASQLLPGFAELLDTDDG